MQVEKYNGNDVFESIDTNIRKQDILDICNTFIADYDYYENLGLHGIMIVQDNIITIEISTFIKALERIIHVCEYNDFPVNKDILPLIKSLEAYKGFMLYVYESKPEEINIISNDCIADKEIYLKFDNISEMNAKTHLKDIIRVAK